MIHAKGIVHIARRDATQDSAAEFIRRNTTQRTRYSFMIAVIEKMAEGFSFHSGQVPTSPLTPLGSIEV